MVQQVPFKLPRPVDADNVGQMVEKCIQDEYRMERMRRKRTVSDELRETVDTRGLPAGTFSYSNVSMHEPWQETYFNRYGGQALPINQNYQCRHCGMTFQMGYPPEVCPRCHQDTDFGRMVKDGVYKK